MSENTEDQVNLEPLSDAELEAARAQGQDEAQFLEALEAKGLTVSLPGEEELAAIPPLPLLQDFITVPDGGLVFRTTTGRPLLSISPYEDGSRLDLYGAGSAPDVQIIATSAGCTIHLAQQAQSVLSLSASNGYANIVTRNPEGMAVSVLTTEAGGASLGLYDAAGQLVHLSSSAGPSVSVIDSAHFPPGMTRN